MTRPRVVVCGGGAGGLELVIRLAARGDVDVTLVDREDTHLWKPLLHELAAGTLDASSHEVSYLALARWHGFTFCQGPLAGLDRAQREVRIGPVGDEDGQTLIPERSVAYDLLVIAIGGVSNDFGIPGVAENARPLDTAADAEAIRQEIVKACMAANYGKGHDAARLEIVIVGGGATGVELAAELRSTTRMLISYGLDRLDPERFMAITVLNADPRLLSQLSPSVSESIGQSLSDLGVEVVNGAVVAEVLGGSVRTRSGATYPSALTVWAAGVRAPPLLQTLDGLETSRQGQLVVGPDLRTSRDDRVLALGDCAACPWIGGKGQVPARAQASQQQAVYLADHIVDLLAGRRPEPFRYRDFGSLVSLGSDGSAIGTLMGFITGRSYRVRGLLAHGFYRWLYRRHRAALFGWPAALLESVGFWIGTATRPRIKLH